MHGHLLFVNSFGSNGENCLKRTTYKEILLQYCINEVQNCDAYYLS